METRGEDEGREGVRERRGREEGEREVGEGEMMS